jgi:DNA-directed RNA polymerase subunit RPC12/RpoP
MGTHSNYSNVFYKDYEQLFQRNEKLAGELRSVRYNFNLLEKKYETAERRSRELAEQNSAKDAAIIELAREIERLKSMLNIDGTNSGLPTSKTPIGKKKVIPNSREKTDKKIGGQYGHAKKTLERFHDAEVNDIAEHALEECPYCGGKDLQDTGAIEKDCLDYKITVEKTRHVFPVYRCKSCGKDFHERIPNELKEDNQYGPQVRALALALINQGNVSLNKVRKIIHGFTGGGISLSEGYLCKLQQKASKAANDFCEEIRGEILRQRLVYWDDTVIMINTKRACLRYYGTERLALYKAHMHKDKEGLDRDNILNLLPATATTEHDHNKVNYNKDYAFGNAECNEHLLRDLKRIRDNLGHKWAEELSGLLADGNKRRDALKNAGASEFPHDELSRFLDEFDRIMLDAYAQNGEAGLNDYTDQEKTLILRILDFKNEYLAWVTDFDIPFTNNLSERSLRDAKSKMKISGQFQNITTATYYAGIKSYIETCNRNETNVFYALLRLCIGHPFTLNEILHPPQT